MIHFDQSVASDITEMAELSQQQKSHEERDTQSLLHAKLLVSKTNKLQTLANRSLFKTQTSSSKDLHLLNLYVLLVRALHRMTGCPQTAPQPAHDWHWLEGHHTSTVRQHRQLPKWINSKATCIPGHPQLTQPDSKYLMKLCYSKITLLGFYLRAHSSFQFGNR